MLRLRSCFCALIVCAAVCAATRYEGAEVDLAVEGPIFNPSGYRVLSAKPIDTSVFRSRADDIVFPADWIGMTISADSLRFGDPGSSRFYPTDSLPRNFFLGRVLAGDGPSGYSIDGPESLYVRQSNPPFPLRDALSILGGRIGKTRLGWIWGGHGFATITAYNDHFYWYIRDWHGGGDCPAGCTIDSVTTYRVLSDAGGTGICVAHQILLEPSVPPPPFDSCSGHYAAALRPPIQANPKARKSIGTQAAFDALGRLREARESMRFGL